MAKKEKTKKNSKGAKTKQPKKKKVSGRMVRMTKKDNFEWKSESAADIHTAYKAGKMRGKEHAPTHAYYAGIGYGKAVGGKKSISFKSDEEFAAFRRGMKNAHKEFVAFEHRDPTLWERIRYFFTPNAERRRNREISKFIDKEYKVEEQAKLRYK